ncbi:MAG: glycine--tRNA ligase subunit beta [Candidatus Omnitrophica bacterium CG11_big_fil_rev_8_21_14_0_20_63_9]|nr:MAG: glycine--tRNA ligase subunit beta [Candidatus Omnitrophica bacterium CG11_big_fil_rev_8_21_14_0_20_63_9]
MKRSKISHAPRPTPHAPQAADLLLEIGTEELPAAYLPDLIDQLRREAAALLAANHLTAGEVSAWGAPRRLVLHIRALCAVQRKPAVEVRGPSQQAAYDKEGNPTQALLGFLRSQQGSVNHTKLISGDKGAYVFLVKPAITTPTVKVLPELLPQLIGKLKAPKTMRWDASGVRFARPIRWLLALYGTTPIRCTCGRLSSAARTWIDGPKHPRAVAVKSPEQYLAALTRSGTLLNQDERRAWIEQTINKAAKQAGGRIAPEMISYGLLDEVTHLVERPVPLEGRFDSSYLALPREVLLASMAKHQRVFAIDAGSKLAPRLVAILEGTPAKPQQVRQVIERILNARLADSLLFWKEDLKRPLETVPISGIAVHEKLGSMQDKAERLRQLAHTLAELWQLGPEERRDLERACRLAKADLATTMVREFPTLQGIMGKHYALQQGEPRAVAEAIGEHYLPLADKLPKTLLGGALSIIDKYDTLAGYFSIGIQPTGDQDPFGLRRAAQGIVEVAWSVHRPLRLDALLKTRATLKPFGANAQADAAAIGRGIRQYLVDRLYTFAWPKPAPSVDCIDAVLASPGDDLIDLMDRIRMLQQLYGHPALLKAAKVIERTRNILKGASVSQRDVDPAHLKEAPERTLWDLYQQQHGRVAELAQRKSYADATRLFGEQFFEPLHAFFDHVLVNVPEEPLKQNRLALMRAIHQLYTDRIADLSKLSILQTAQPKES